MPTVDWDSVKRSKDEYRERVRSRSFEEKLRTLERLREREAQLRKLRRRKSDSTSARSILILGNADDSAGQAIGSSKLVVLGANATFISSVITRDAASVSATRTVLFTREVKKP